MIYITDKQYERSMEGRFIEINFAYQMKQSISIALVGAESLPGETILKRLYAGGFRPSLIAGSEAGNTRLEEVAANSGLEIMNCPREACWEADLILLVVPGMNLDWAVERIKDVAVQKPVVCFKYAEKEISVNLESSFAYSGLVFADFDKANTDFSEVTLSGENLKQVEEMAEWLKNIGFKTQLLINQ